MCPAKLLKQRLYHYTTRIPLSYTVKSNTVSLHRVNPSQIHCKIKDSITTEDSASLSATLTNQRQYRYRRQCIPLSYTVKSKTVLSNQTPYHYTKTVHPSQLLCKIKDSTVKSNTVSLHKDSASLSYTDKSKTVSLHKDSASLSYTDKSKTVSLDKDSASLSATLTNQRPYRYTKTVHPSATLTNQRPYRYTKTVHPSHLH